METLSDLSTQRPYAVRQVNKAFLFFLRLILKPVHLLRKMFLQMSVVCCSQPKQSSSFLLFSSIYRSLCKTDHTQKEAKWEDSTLTFFLFHLLFLQCIISNTFWQPVHLFSSFWGFLCVQRFVPTVATFSYSLRSCPPFDFKCGTISILNTPQM